MHKTATWSVARIHLSCELLICYLYVPFSASFQIHYWFKINIEQVKILQESKISSVKQSLIDFRRGKNKYLAR